MFQISLYLLKIHKSHHWYHLRVYLRVIIKMGQAQHMNLKQCYLYSVQDQFHPLLPVIDPAQLQVILLISSSSSHDDTIVLMPTRTHSMTTRLQSGVIDRKIYNAYVSV